MDLETTAVVSAMDDVTPTPSTTESSPEECSTLSTTPSLPAWGAANWESGSTASLWDASNVWNFSIPEVTQLKMKTRQQSEVVHLEDDMFAGGTRILFSCPEAWELFFKSKPTAVAIDCEGNRFWHKQFGYSIMIEIASPEFVIIEFPTDNRNEEGVPALSTELAGLLSCPSTVKIVFATDSKDLEGLQSPCIPVVDLVDILRRSGLGTPFQRERLDTLGLVDILSISTERKYEKCSIKKQGWGSLLGASAMRSNKHFVCYGAAEVWGILLAYRAMIAKLGQTDEDVISMLAVTSP